MPAIDSSRRAAYEAAKNSVAVFDVSNRTQIEITGADRTRFLHSFSTNNIKALKPGQGCESFITNLKGKVVAHFYVFSGENSLWLDGTPGQLDAAIGHLKKYVLIDDVQLTPQNEIRGELLVTGPHAAQLLQLENELALYGQVTRGSAGAEFDIRRVDLLGVTGFLLSMPISQRESVKLSMVALGVEEGSRELFDLLRIEAGFPNYGTDITDDNLAQEVARTKRAISFDKGCYLGQETIARLDSMGHTNRELRRLTFSTDVVPSSGSSIFDADGMAEVGVITSAALNPFTESAPQILAMGMVKRGFLNPDTAVTLKDDNGPISGRVLGLFQ